MGVKSGTFGASSGDRVYSSTEYTAPINDLFTDGVLKWSVGEFEVVPYSGMVLKVGPGKALCRNKWCYIPSNETVAVTIDNANVLNDRYDAVVLRFNYILRKAEVFVIKGVASLTPSYPSLVDSETVKDILLAYINVTAGTVNISGAQVLNKVGTSESPYSIRKPVENDCFISLKNDQPTSPIATQKDGVIAIEPFEETRLTSESNIFTGELVSFDDAGKADLNALNVSFEPTQDLNGQAYPYPAGGGKNKLPYDIGAIKAINTGGSWNGNTYSLNGISFAFDSEGKIVVSGTLTDTLSVIRMPVTLAAGTYILNGMVSVANSYLQYQEGSYWSGTNLSGSGTSITSSGTSAFVWLYIRSTVSTAKTISPMLRLSSESDSTFAPYSNICPVGILEPKDKYDSSTNTAGYYYDDNLEWTSSSDTTVITDYIACNGKTRAIQVVLSSVAANVNLRVNCFNASKVIQSQIKQATISGTLTYDFTIPVDTFYIRISTNISNAPFSKILVSEYDGLIGLTVKQEPKNIFDSDGTASGYYNSDGSTKSNANYLRTTRFSPVKPGSTVTLSFSVSAMSLSNLYGTLCFYDKNKNWIERSTDYVFAPSAGNYSGQFEIPNNTYYIRGYFPYTVSNIQVEYGTSATNYEGNNIIKEATIVDYSYYNDQGVPTDTSGTKRIADYIPVTGKQRYAFIWGNNNSGYRLRVHEYDADKKWLRQVISVNIQNTSVTYIYTASSDAAYMRFSLPRQATGISFSVINADIESDWESTTAPIFGGSLEIISGALKRKYSETIYKNSSNFTFYTNSGVRYIYIAISAAKAAGKIFSSKFKNLGNVSGASNFVGKLTNSANAGVWCIGMYSNGSRVYIGNSLYTTTSYTEDQYKSIINALLPLQIVYERSSQSSYEITHKSVVTLEGKNNFWSNDGSLSVAVPKYNYLFKVNEGWWRVSDDYMYTDVLTAPGYNEVTLDHQNPSIYLYNNGNEYTAITGGWAAYKRDGYTTNAVDGSAGVTKNSDSITINQGGDSYYFISTNNAIDLSRYSKLIVTFKRDSGHQSYSNAQLCGSPTYNLIDGGSRYFSQTMYTGSQYEGQTLTFEFDISAYSMSAFIGILSYYAVNTIYSIRLE